MKLHHSWRGEGRAPSSPECPTRDSRERTYQRRKPIGNPWKTLLLLLTFIAATLLSGIPASPGTTLAQDTAKWDLWIEEWVAKDALPHDVTEGDDISFTVKRDTDSTGGLSVGLSFEERVGSPDYTTFVTHGADNPKPSKVIFSLADTDTTNDHSITVTIKTTDDSAWERDSWLDICIDQYADNLYRLGDPEEEDGGECTSFRIRDNDPPPSIRPEILSSSITEGDLVDLRLHRTLPAGKTSPHMSGELTVYVSYHKSVTDQNGNITLQPHDPSSATARGHAVTFEAGDASTDFTYQTADNQVDNPTLRLVLKVNQDHAANSLYRPRWKPAPGNEAVMLIGDDEDPTITVAADEASYQEDEGPAEFTLTRDGETVNALTVNVEITQEGGYLDGTLPTTVTFQAGSTTTTLSLPLAPDDEYGEDGSVTVTVTAGVEYEVGTTGSATTEILNDDRRQHVYVDPQAQDPDDDSNHIAQTEVEEGENASFRVRRRLLELDGSGLTSRGIASLDALTVKIEVTQEGDFMAGDEITVRARDPQGDWNNTTRTLVNGETTITIPAGRGDAWVLVPTEDDYRLWALVPDHRDEYRRLKNWIARRFQKAHELDGAVNLKVLEGDGYAPGKGDSLEDQSAKVTVRDNEPPLVNLTFSNQPEDHSPRITNSHTIEEGDSVDIWVTRFFDDNSEELPVQVRVRMMGCLRGTSNKVTRAIRAEWPLENQDITITIPAGQRRAKHTLTTGEDTLHECDPRVRVHIRPPDNARQLPSYVNIGSLSLHHERGYQLWDYHRVVSIEPGSVVTLDKELIFPTKLLNVHDDDPPPDIHFGDLEVDENTGTAEVKAWLSHNEHVWDYQMDWWLIEDTASLGEDYTNASGTVTLPKDPGNTDPVKQTLSIPIIDDDLYEPGGDETIIIGYTIKAFFSNDLNDVVNLASSLLPAPKVSIKDDEGKPTVSIGNAQGPEGDVTMSFPVTLSNPSTQSVTVQWETSEDTGDNAATSDEDYTAGSGTLTFQPGETEQEITVTLRADTTVEAGETFSIKLKNPVNATCTDCQATGTIQDTSPDPYLVLTGPSDALPESAGDAVFRVKLIHPVTGNATHSNDTVTVEYMTMEGDGEDNPNANDATEGDDYTSASGTLTFDPGQRTKTVRVPITDDNRRDWEEEHFRMALGGPTNADLDPDGDGYDDTADEGDRRIHHVVVIQDNDPKPAISIDDVEVTETVNDRGIIGAHFTISLDRPSDQDVSVQVTTADGTAKSGEDYEFNSRKKNFTADDTEETFTVKVNSDLLDETTETFLVNLTSPQEATLGDDQGTGTILDNTPPLQLFLKSAGTTAPEGQSATFDLILLPPGKTDSLDEDIRENGVEALKEIRFQYQTASGNSSSGNATEGSDFTRTSGTAAIPTGQNGFSISVPLLEDNLHEGGNTDGNEEFRLILSAPSNVSFQGGQSTWTLTGTIRDSDDKPSATIEDVRAMEDAGTLDFTVSLSHPTTLSASVRYHAVGKTENNQLGAEFNTDFKLSPGKLTFASMETEKTISVELVDDRVHEPDETFRVSIYHDPNDDEPVLVRRDESATGTILDDDLPLEDQRRLVFNPTRVVVDEGDADGTTYTVKLSHQPDDTVTVQISGTAGTDLTVGTTSLTFTTSNWGITQEVRVTAAHDEDGGDDRETLTHSTSETGEGSFDDGTFDLPVKVDDDDPRGLIINPQELTVPEEDEDGAKLTVRLATKPTADVTVFNNRGNSSILTADPVRLTFTPQDWDTPQEVTFTASGDDDSHSQRLKVVHHSLGGDYERRRKSSFVIIEDNDPPGLVFDPSGVTVLEEDTDGTGFKVSLATQPTGDVTLTSPAAGEMGLTFSPGTLTFTDVNWDVQQNMNVTAAHDNDTSDDMKNVVFGTTGGGYDDAEGLLTVTITDNDQIGVNISEESIELTEGEDRTYRVVLGGEPTGDVTVSVQGPANSDITVRPASLPFTQQNWSDEQNVTVTAVHDQDHLDEEPAQITHSVSGGNYSGLSVDPVALAVRDDDDPIVVASFQQGTANAPEGSQVQVSITLDAAPERALDIPITVTRQGGATQDDHSTIPGKVTFSPRQTSASFTFTITDDDVDDDGESILITFGTLPERVRTNTGSTSLTVTINDDDQASITVSPNSLDLDEGDTGHYTVVLGSQPTGDVTITLGLPADAPFTLSRSSLTFTASTWEIEQRVTVRASHDQDADDEGPITITHTAGGGGYSGQAADSVTVEVTDDDGPGVKVQYKKTIYQVDEGSRVEVSVTLSADPERELIIPLSTTDKSTAPSRSSPRADSFASPDDYSGVPAQVTFDSTETEQKFDIMATDDSTDDDGEILYLAFRNLPPGVTLDKNYTASVRINDDDLPSTLDVEFEEAVYEVDETDDPDTPDTNETQATVTVTLSDDPEQTVSVPITVILQGGATSADYSGVEETLVFNSGDTEKSFTFTAKPDSLDDDGESVKLTFGTLPTILTEKGNDEAVVTINDDDFTVNFQNAEYTATEGGNTTITVTLSEDPGEQTRIPIVITNQGEASQNDHSGVPDHVTFESGDTEESFIFRATDDNLDEDDEMVKLSFSSTLPERVARGNRDETTVTIVDNDSDSVSIRPTSLTVPEGGSRTYAVRLNTKPAGNVTVTVHDPTDNSDVTAQDSSLTFTTTTWNLEQNVTVSAAQDEDGADDSATITHSVSGYGSVTTAPSVAVTVTDDEPAVEVEFKETVYTVSESDDPDTPGDTENQVTIRVTLDPDPDRQVIIYLVTTQQGTSGNTDFTGIPGSLTFNDGDTEKSFTFTAVHDTIDEEEEKVKLGFRDLPARVTAGTKSETTITIQDDDQGSVRVAPTKLDLDEGSNGEYRVRLNSKPQEDVTITVTPPANTDVTLMKNTLTFTGNDWDTDQAVRVSAAQDDTADDETASITHSITSSDPDYSGITVSGVTVNVDDDETPEVVLSDNSIEVAEGSTDGTTYTVRLSHKPTVNVTVTITKTGADHADLTLGDTSLTFTPENWMTPQRVKVTAAQDGDANNGAATLTHTAMGGEYGEAAESLIVTIEDDDTPSVIIEPTSLTIDEGSNKTYRVRLTSLPTASVTIAIARTGSSDVTLDQSSLTFTTTTWEDWKTVRVSAAQDQDADHDSATITHTVTSTDTDYSGSSPDSVTVTVKDDETPTVKVSYGESSYSVTEGTGITIKVTLDREPRRSLEIPIRTQNLGTTSSSDYQGVPDKLTFGNNDTEETFTFTARTDSINDPNEMVKLTFGTLPAMTEGGTNTETTITIRETAAQGSLFARLDAAYYSLQEGGSITITVILDNAPGSEVTIPITTTNGTGVTSGDYSLPGMVTFGSDDTERDITFTATDDDIDEENETVTVALESLPGGILKGTPSSSTVTITDDDTRGVSIRPTTLEISEGGTKQYRVKLDSQPTGNVTVTVLDPTDNSDVTVRESTLTFTQHNWDRDKRVTVSAAHDDDNDDETATITHSVSGGDYGSVAAEDVAVTVLDDDQNEMVRAEFSQDSYTVQESDDPSTRDEEENRVTITVTLNRDPERTVTIPITRKNRGGASDSDYSGVPEQVVFDSGETEQTFDITVTHDNEKEDGESIRLRLGDLPPGVSPGVNKTTLVKIGDDDAYLSFLESSHTVLEGETIRIPVKLTRPLGRTLEIPILVYRESGASNKDFNLGDDKVTFGPQEDRQHIVFNALADNKDEPTDRVTITFGPLPDGLEPFHPFHTNVEIQNVSEEPVPIIPLLLSADNESMKEGDGTDDRISIKISRLDELPFAEGQTITLDLRGTATPGTDYTVTPADADTSTPGHQVSITKEQDTRTVELSPVDDSDQDPCESILASATLGTKAAPDTPQIVITIQDNDNSAGSTKDLTVGLEGMVYGVLTEADSGKDWYSFSATGNTSYIIEVKHPLVFIGEGSSAAGGTPQQVPGYLIDPSILQVIDEDDEQVLGEHDGGGFNGNLARAFFTPTQDGTYRVAVGAGAQEPKGLGCYSISVRADDHADDIRTGNGAVLRAGESITASIDSDVAHSDGGLNPWDWEGTPGSETPRTGIESLDDRDFFQAKISEAGNYRFTISEKPKGVGIWRIWDRSGAIMMSPENAPASQFKGALKKGRYYVEVGTPYRSDGNTGSYKITMTKD